MTDKMFALAISAAMASIAYGGTKLWIGADGADWHDPNNWMPNGVPTAGDRAKIYGFAHIYTADAIADTLEVYGKLRVDAGRTLVLENDDSNTAGGPPDDSLIDGTVTLGSGSSTGKLRFEVLNHKIDGTGFIALAVGRIEIESQIVFTTRFQGLLVQRTMESLGRARFKAIPTTTARSADSATPDSCALRRS